MTGLIRSRVSVTLLAAVALTAAGCGGKESSSAKNAKPSNKGSSSLHTGEQHDLDATPAQGVDLAGAPLNVTINTTGDLDLKRSSVEVVDEDGSSAVEGAPQLVGNGTSFQQPLKPELADGDYKVKYELCGVDGESCDTSSYTFTVKRALSDDYIDMRGKQAVTIDMRDIQFVEKEVVVSPGTKVTWTNSDAVDHFVNTDTHPAHTYYPPQNSRSISKGETYTVTFDKTGVYPYHCSAHTDMTATLVVA